MSTRFADIIWNVSNIPYFQPSDC